MADRYAGPTRRVRRARRVRGHPATDQSRDRCWPPPWWDGAGADLEASLNAIHQSDHLALAGLMGYEPHLTKLPNIAGWPKRAKQGAANQFQLALSQTAAIFGQDFATNMVRNMAAAPRLGSTPIRCWPMKLPPAQRSSSRAISICRY